MRQQNRDDDGPSEARIIEEISDAFYEKERMKRRCSDCLDYVVKWDSDRCGAGHVLGDARNCGDYTPE